MNLAKALYLIWTIIRFPFRGTTGAIVAMLMRGTLTAFLFTYVAINELSSNAQLFFMIIGTIWILQPMINRLDSLFTGTTDIIDVNKK